MADFTPNPRTAWIVMGVSGCGKSTIGRNLAEALEVTFADADDFHPTTNIEKMSRGDALTDEDRRPWLTTLRNWLAEHAPCVLACSALRQVYRDALESTDTKLRFVHLAADFDTIRARMESREHFMPAALLQSQFDTLEPPSPRDALILDATLSADQLVAAIVSDARV